MVKELKIDFDLKNFRNKKWNLFLYQFRKLFINLLYYRGIRIEDIKVWETGKGFHIILTLNKDISYEEQLLFQCFLLSDIVRELFNYCRYISGDLENYNFFAKRKKIYDKNGNIVYESREKITKNSNRILRRLLKEWEKVKMGEYKFMLGEYY